MPRTEPKIVAAAVPAASGTSAATKTILQIICSLFQYAIATGGLRFLCLTLRPLWFKAFPKKSITTEDTEVHRARASRKSKLFGYLGERDGRRSRGEVAYR